jgi:hypothetical protein
MVTDDDQPAGAADAHLGRAVEDAMRDEVWRALAPRFQQLTMQHDEIRAPRERQDESVGDIATA